MYEETATNEWRIGSIPSSNCDNYDPSAQPSYGELIDLLARERFATDEIFLLLVGGKMQSPDRECSAPSFTSRRRNVLRALSQEMDSQFGTWNASDSAKFALDPANTGTLVKRLLGLHSEPQHVTGFIVRRV